MKVRLIQDSYTKKYTIEHWEETSIFGTDGTYTTAGRWSYIWPWMWGDVRGQYKPEEKELALKEFEHMVSVLKSQTIVVKEVDTSEV